MRSSNGIQSRSVGSLVLVATCAAAALAQPGAGPGPRVDRPVVCYGNQEIRLVDHRISTTGDAVVASGNCEVYVRKSRLEADGVAVRASGNAVVRLVDSYVSGRLGSLRADGNSEIRFSGSEIRGRMGSSGFGELVDGGDNTLVDTGGARVQTGDPDEVRVGTIEIGAGGIRVGGVTVDDEGITVGGEVVIIDEEGISVGGEAVIIDDRGVSVGPETVVVDPEGNVRIDSPDGTVIVADDWRDRGTVYTDTDRVLIELNAVTEGDRIRLDLAGDVLFDFDSAAVRDAAAAQLSRVAHVVRRRAAGRVTVVGHTDSVGSAAYNQKLSKDRAAAVIRWLHRVEGIPLELMTGYGLGATRPIAHNTRPDGSDDPAGRARNRRVEIQILTGG